MDFALSDEQQMLRDSVAKYVADHGGVERHRKLAAGDTGFEPRAWQAMAELGWLALPFAEADGGLGGSATDLMVLCEALGQALVREPFLHTVASCGGLLAGAASDAQRGDWLPPLLAGESQWALALAEVGSGFALSAIDSAVTAAGDGLRLDGSKLAVLNGHVADWLIVSAREADGISLFVVPADAAGIARSRFTAVDGSSGADITFDNVALGGDQRLGAAGEGEALLAGGLSLALVAIGAEAVGAMQVLLDTTVAYCKTREQFGQPIGKFQALQHRMADMFLKLEETRSLVYNAAILLQEGDHDAMAACAALKVKVAEASRFVSHEAVQLHGGMGMTDELIVSHLFKRLLLLSKLYGDGDYYLRRYLDCRAA